MKTLPMSTPPMAKGKPPTGPSRSGSSVGDDAKDTDGSDREPGVPEPIERTQDSITKNTTIPVMDEHAFMTECADRINSFLVSYPNEAQHVLSIFVKYEHELVDVHESYRRKARLERGELPLDDEDEEDDEDLQPPAGAPVLAIMAAILQTHVGNGWYLRPVLVRDPTGSVGTRIVKMEVIRQDDSDPDDASARS